MKIDPISSLQRTSPVKSMRPARRSKRHAFAQELEASSDPVSPVQPTEALLSLQAAEETPPALTAFEKGEHTLDLLKELQLSLLEGHLTRDHLQHLLETTARQEAHVQDPALRDILEEIMLRAQIELAKYNR